MLLINQTAVVTLPGAIVLQSRQDKPLRDNLYTKKVLISADRRFAGTETLIRFVKSSYPLAKELIIEKEIINKEDILSELNKNYDIYILVGHSGANTKLPDLSFFEVSAMSTIDSTSKTVEVTLEDFKKINWSQAELVFLVGCETAMGKINRIIYNICEYIQWDYW